MQKLAFLVILAFSYASSDRIYEGGCPDVIPMPDFDMKKFLGVWYQVQPDFDSDDESEPNLPSCEFYNITNDHRVNTFLVNTTFELYTPSEENTIEKFASISTGHLTALDDSLPAKLYVEPTSGAHIIESNLTIFATDYESYAVISNCDKQFNDGDFQFNQHTTLWSRVREIDESFVDKLWDSIGVFDFDPYDLTSVSTTGCIEGGRKIATVNLDNEVVIPHITN